MYPGGMETSGVLPLFSWPCLPDWTFHGLLKGHPLQLPHQFGPSPTVLSQNAPIPNRRMPKDCLIFADILDALSLSPSHKLSIKTESLAPRRGIGLGQVCIDHDWAGRRHLAWGNIHRRGWGSQSLSKEIRTKKPRDCADCVGLGIAAGCEVLYILNWWSCWVTAMLGCAQAEEACPDQGWGTESSRYKTTQSESTRARQSVNEWEQE